MQATPLTIRTMVKQTGTVMLLLGIACIPSVGQVIAMGILIVAACFNPAWALRSLAAGVLVTFLNPALSIGSESSTLVGALKWILLFVACGRSLVSRVEPSKPYVQLIGLWALMTAVLLSNSYLVSLFPSISVFKAVAFSLGILCIIRLTALTAHRNKEMVLFIGELGVTVFIASLPLLAIPGIGYFRNGTGFQGVLSQPQGLGIFLVITGASTFAAASSTPRLSRVLFVMGLAQWSMIGFTKCRTALVAIALCAIVYLIESFMRKDNTVGSRYIFSPAVVLAIIGLIIAVTISTGMRDGFNSYLRKGQSQSFDPDNPEISLRESSRGGQVFDTLGLAEKHPVFGAGFGVDEDSGLRSEDSGSKLYGIPLTAPSEQGFLPIASVAQLGIVGSLFVLAFLLTSFGLARQTSGEISALFVAALGINIGEMVFYSIGGLGCLMWILLILFSFSSGSFHIRSKVSGI